MITGLFMGWTDPISEQWFPIKKMTWSKGKYYTVYLQGMEAAIACNPSKGAAVKAGLIKLDRVEITNEIEVSFRTRMPVNRPFTDTAELARLGLSTDLNRFDPFEYIARSGGYSGVDTSDVFPEVIAVLTEKYQFHFGSEYIEGVEISEYISQLRLGSQLRIEGGLIYDRDTLLGKAPGYIANLAASHPLAVKLTVAQINHHTYKFDKLLCHAQIDGKIAIPFSDAHYQPLVDILAVSK